MLFPGVFCVVLFLWSVAAVHAEPARTELDLRTDTPRDPQVPYLPAEKYPFAAPYTAEEMGYRAMEFTHISCWSHAMADAFGALTSSGYLNQGVMVGLNFYLPGDEGMMGQVHTAPGEDYYRMAFYQGKLNMIEERLAKQENPAREDRGYAALLALYYDLSLDLMSYSLHDAHLVKEWTPKDREVLFGPDFMRRGWLKYPLKTQALINSPAEFYLRPLLYQDKFPQERKIELSPEVARRVRAQEAAGHTSVRLPSPGECTVKKV